MGGKFVYANAMGQNTAQKVAIVLTGCGFKDGTEITEAVSTLIALGQQGLGYQCFAPDLTVSALNHKTDAQQAPRHVGEEATRITRSEVQSLKNLQADNFAALVLPGGFGVAQHLCTWATAGAQAQVRPEMAQAINSFYDQEKPILAICIAPALVACVLGSKGVTLSIGCDQATAQQITQTGAQHVECGVSDFVSDREHRIISTPAYMYDQATPAQVFQGVQKAVQELAAMA